MPKCHFFIFFLGILIPSLFYALEETPSENACPNKNQEYKQSLCQISDSLDDFETPSIPDPFCYFHPPKGWEITDMRTASSKVKMAFIKKTKKEGFCPSLNLAIENVEGTLNEYLNDVKAIYEQDRKNHWRKLGKVRTNAGDAQLTEIDMLSPLGSVRMLQLILIKERQAYIITAAALKNDFCSYYRDFQEAFHSLTVTSDLFEAIPQLERKTVLKQAVNTLIWARSEEEFEKNHWIPFQKKLQEEYEDMGSFWQTLFLKDIHAGF